MSGGVSRTFLFSLFCVSDVALVPSFSPRFALKLPMVGQRVTIEGQVGVYIVLRLDLRRYAADLILTTGAHELELDVPFFALEPARQKTVRPPEKSEASK
jgi:hypothetical protein